MTQQSMFADDPIQTEASPRSVHAGPRQTVSRVRHPNRGEGFAVRDNGPSFFEAIDGCKIEMPVRCGGCSLGHPSRSWVVLHDPDHGRVEADQIGASSATHSRKTFPLLGSGWLVWEMDDIRFEPDDGREFRFTWSRVVVGTPDYVQRHDKADRSRARKKEYPEPTEEENKWITFFARTGEVYAFREVG
jgi:hypothetical protein